MESFFMLCEERKEGNFYMELKTIALTKKFGGRIAVNDLNLTFTNGVYGLLGANGAGKTTFMRLLCNLQNPTSGEILLDGKNIAGLGESYRKLLGYLPQHFVYYPDFTAIEFLLYVAALKGLNDKATEKKSKELLDEVGLTAESRRKIKTFSGGMKQRLGIAQAMLNDPRVLILDEPTAGLDPKERVRFRNLISTFSQNKIVLLSTHIVSDVEYIAGTILVMKKGKFIHEGRPHEIIHSIDGKIWECMVPSTTVPRLMERFNIGNLRSEGDQTLLRIISDEKPLESAVSAAPNLEDLYLYYFSEEAPSAHSAE